MQRGLAMVRIALIAEEIAAIVSIALFLAALVGWAVILESVL